jgi:two-component sensor histidine kinase
MELPESVSLENPSDGFGVKLVSMLVNQPDESIEIERGNSTKFDIDEM